MPCPPSVPISVIPPVSQGVGPLVWRNGSQVARLTTPLNPSWLVYDGSVTRWGDGSAQAPVLLPNLQQVQQSNINFAVGLQSNGQLAAFVNTSINPNNALVTATGSTEPRTLANRFANVVNVQDFGADPTGVVDSYPAFLAAINLLQTDPAFPVSNKYRGGVLYIPSGLYKINNELSFDYGPNWTESSGVNIFIQGNGAYNTTLDFSGAPAGTNGIKFNGGRNFSIENIAILNAKQDGILASNTSLGVYAVQFVIRNVQCKFCGSNGINIPLSYLGTIEDCWLEGNQGNGLNLDGFHTSMNILRVSAPLNKANGFRLNGVMYSSFQACASDSNDYAGYDVTNCHGITFDGCGCESNKREGWLLKTGIAYDYNIPSVSRDIRGVVFDGCVALFNSTSSAGTYANFITAVTADSRPIEIIVNGGSSSENVANNTSFVLYANSGNISITRDFVYIGTTNDTVKLGIVTEFIKINGCQVYNNDTSLTSSSYNNTSYVSGNTYYENFKINGGLQGYISYNGSNIVYATASDYRLKENIVAIQNPIDKVNQLNPVEYTWKSNNKKSSGFLAHELKEIIPNAVVGDKDEVNKQGEPVYQCVDYSLIVPTLVAAVKKLSEQNKNLILRIEALELK